MTDHELAELCARTYYGFAVRHADDATVICCRASRSLRDWTQDLFVLNHYHPVLGRLHAGFFTEASQIAPEIAKVGLGRPFVLTGHSRGGALALLLGALLKAQGRVASAIVTFGAPRAGGIELADYLADIPIRQYRCGDDPVPYWPDAPFCTARPLLQVGAPLQNPLKDHEISRYVSEVRNGVEAAKPVGDRAQNSGWRDRSNVLSDSHLRMVGQLG